jgi:hypothetical protein
MEGACPRCDCGPGAARGKNNAGMASSNATRGYMAYDNGEMTEEEMIAETIAWLLQECDLCWISFVFSRVVMLMLLMPE